MAEAVMGEQCGVQASVDGLHHAVLSRVLSAATGNDSGAPAELQSLTFCTSTPVAMHSQLQGEWARQRWLWCPQSHHRVQGSDVGQGLQSRAASRRSTAH